MTLPVEHQLFYSLEICIKNKDVHLVGILK